METKQPAREPADVAIIGGGLAGLTAASTVAADGCRPIVYERRRDIGGDARSTSSEGFIFNQGPHALYRGGPAERILRELGVKLRGGVPPVKGRMVLEGEMHIAPNDGTSSRPGERSVRCLYDQPWRAIHAAGVELGRRHGGGVVRRAQRREARGISQGMEGRHDFAVAERMQGTRSCRCG